MLDRVPPLAQAASSTPNQPRSRQWRRPCAGCRHSTSAFCSSASNEYQVRTLTIFAISSIAPTHTRSMSDYNRMKRITSTGIVSQPMVATASNPSSGRYGQQYYAPPPLPPSNRVQQGNARQETMAARSNGSARQDEDSRRQAADTLLHMQSRPLAAKQAGSAPRSTALSRPQPSLEPPPAPKLHRTYTEEEGENPQYHAPAPQSLVGRSPDLSRSLGSGAGSALATPALSMSASSSTSMQDRKASRTSASIPGTPSEGINLSPVQPRTIKDESNDKILSDMLTDAMEDRMLPTSAIPINVNKSQPMAGSAAAHLQGLGIAKSASPASQSLSAIMSRSDTSAAPSLPAYSPALTTGNYDVFHPSLAGVKTSLTHPMNISPLLPPELLPLYGGSIFNAGPTKGADATRSRSPLGKLSVNVDSNGDDTRPPSPTKLARPSSPSKSGGTSASRPTSPVKGSSSSMMSVSRPSTPSVPSVDVAGKPFVVAPSADIHTLIGPNAGPELFKLSLPISQSLAMTSSKEGTLQNGNAGASSGGSPAPARMGNLVLCSCPGKKVRLSDEHLSILGVPEICRPGGAPVDPRGLPGAAVPLPGNNRSPICRDIELDFRRAMTHGDVKVVVCCIDDAELRFLGAAWEEYARVADELGLEVIR